MCGIFLAIPKSSKQLDHEACNKALNYLKKRGPDYQGAWIGKDSEPLLVHTRLSLVDESINGQHPMIRRDGNTVIVFNGESYNHKDLRKSYKNDAKENIFRGYSDTETLLEFIEKYGHKENLYNFEQYCCFNRRVGVQSGGNGR